MSPGSVTLFGAGGHARVVIDVLRAAGEEIECCVAPDGGGSLGGVPVVGESEAFERLGGRDDVRVFVAIGENGVRRRVAGRLRDRGWPIVSAVSPHAYVAPDARIGSGVLVVHGAVVNAGSVIEDDVIVNTGATVDHDNRIGAGAHVAPGCHLAGTVTVGDGAFLGVGTTVIPGITIGARAIVGAGSVVVRDVPADTRSWGNPARLEGKNPL